MSSSRMDTQLQGITDLTLLTPIKPGFVQAYETISYVNRLRTVLKTLNGLRLGARESTHPPSPYTDVVSRFRIVHSFRWAVIDPAPGSNEPHKLLLNVNFDGGWEPYMRVIWRDLGSLLDIILCHSVDYQLSAQTSFERYAQWVRDNEVAPGFLFIESGRSVSDHEYLAAQELLARTQPPPDALEATRLRTEMAGFLKDQPATPGGKFAMAIQGITPLSALYLLDRYFGKGAPDGDCLLRAAHDILFELRSLDTKALFPEVEPDPDPSKEAPPGVKVRQQYFTQLRWLESLPEPVDIQPRELEFKTRDIQGGMLTGYANLSIGALVMLRVEDVKAALGWLKDFPISTEHEGKNSLTEPDGWYHNLSLSLAGLKALGAGPAILARFPQPFREGMEQRAGALGDLRHNHPKYWKTPLRNWPAGAPADDGSNRIDLSSVHILMQLRQGKDSAQPLQQVIETLVPAGSGVRVLAVEAMRRNAIPNASGHTQVRENFGFVDGLSQPQLGADANSTWTDDVPRGELLLGYETCRDPGYAVPEHADALLDNGTFMVVRKLRQHVDLLNTQLDKNVTELNKLTLGGKPLNTDRKELLAKMMGRNLNGTALVLGGKSTTNTFNYTGDPQGSLCPFHSHIRRANPRDRSPDGKAQAKTTPRIVRRGMSYGEKWDPKFADDKERGLFFIAYNANIAEQFETIQRWIAGGNSSGGFAGQSDPFMGVSVDGKPRIFRVELQRGDTDGDGKPESIAVNVDLGAQPFVELQWGSYYFVPSPAALKNMARLLAPAAAPAPQFKAPDVNNFAAWQVCLEDPTLRDYAWAHVRSQPGGVLRTAYGVLVGDAKLVMQVFRNSPDRYSVRGYGERMSDSIGLGYLGLDADTGHTEQAPDVNQAIESITEADAFTQAYAYAKANLAPVRLTAANFRMSEATLDLEQLSLKVLASLCTYWFGLPNKQQMWGTEFHLPQPEDRPQTPRCPREFLAVSRHVFGPHPSEIVHKAGREGGQALQKAVKDWLASQPDLSKLKLVRDTLAAVAKLKAGDPTIEERTLAGIMLGFPPTVHGNLLTVLGYWATTKKLWDLQLDWPTSVPHPADPTQAYVAALGAAPKAYEHALLQLRDVLSEALMRSPVPGQVWRYAKGVPHKLGEVTVVENDLIVVGIASAAAQAGCSHFTPFGGDRNDPVKPAPLHACPGYPMAMGVMMGVIAAVLEVGTLRGTAAPTVLTLPVGA